MRPHICPNDSTQLQVWFLFHQSTAFKTPGTRRYQGRQRHGRWPAKSGTKWDQLSAATIQKCHGSPTQFRRLLLQISSYLWQATNVHFFWIKYYENYSSVPPKERENVKAMRPNSVNQSGVSVLTWNRGSGNKNGDGTLRQIVKCVVLCDKV